VIFIVSVLFQVEPGNLTQTVTLVTYVQWVLGSGLSLDTNYAGIAHCFTPTFQAVAT
jgi:hypothetical protein